MIKVDECEPIGELEAKFPYRDVQIKRGIDVKEYYDLEAEIGRGKFGTVYLCREKKTNLSLAAKFVGIQRRQDRKNVEREVEIMRTLQHPRLIQLYDAFESDNTMVVVLELIEGGELFERVIGDDFILTEKACTIFMRQICEGVAFIHKNNIIHLDLKPENILCLTKTGNRIKIIDFGLARHYEPGSKLQVLFGTPEFVAPEVVNFDQISPATDMWSVGVICYVLLSGLSPFMGDTDVETMANVTLGRYDFDDESFENISENAKDFITNLLLNKKEVRMTADQCLQHPWLKKKIPPPPPELITTKENLRTFVDNYHNINVIADNNVDHVINTKPTAMSAVELITASDKEFMTRDSVKSFSNISNENILPPVRFPNVATNNSVMNGNNLAVNNVPPTNDEMLNMVNANISSLPSPPMFDNASAMVTLLQPDNLASLDDIVHVDENELKNNNNVLVVANNPFESDLVLEEEKLSTSVPLADVPPRVIAAPEVPVASLPFISKSLPAAAAMMDEHMVDQLKPLHIPLIPSLPVPDNIDEPIIVHPPVIGTTLPPKRGSIDVDIVIPKRTIEDDETLKAKRGSIDVISLIPMRGSIDIPKRGSLDTENELITKGNTPPQSISFQTDLPVANTPIQELKHRESPIVEFVTTTPSSSPLSLPQPSKVISNLQLQVADIPSDQITQIPDISPQPSAPIMPASSSISPVTIPMIPQDSLLLQPASPVKAMAPPLEDIFVPQPPVLAKILSTSPVSPPMRPSPTPSYENMPQGTSATLPSISSSINKPYEVLPNKPSPFVPTSPLPRLPTSPVTTGTSNPLRRESPLQKTLDEIPKLSSEILSSLTNLPSLSNSIKTSTSNYDLHSNKSSQSTKRSTNISESSSYSSFEKVSTPRVTSFTETSTSSYSGTLPQKGFPKIQGITLGRTQSEDRSAFANVTSRGFSSSVKRSEIKEIETSRQSSKTETMTRTEMRNKVESETAGFKQKLRSTAPWFSERKAEIDKNLEKRSSDISSLLSENLGPLEKSPWAKEIRQISAKLVEMSKDTTTRKQLEEERITEMNKQQSARRQKFKVSVLNRDVVFGAAREFYLGGEVPVGSPPLKEQLLGKHILQTQSSKAAPRALSPERKSKTPFKTSAK